MENSVGATSGGSLTRPHARQRIETGLTFGRWHQQLHLIDAIRELAAGASVQRVSADLGYESVSAFITMFRKALGKSPAKYLSSVAQETSSRLARGQIVTPAELSRDAVEFDLP